MVERMVKGNSYEHVNGTSLFIVVREILNEDAEKVALSINYRSLTSGHYCYTGKPPNGYSDNVTIKKADFQYWSEWLPKETDGTSKRPC